MKRIQYHVVTDWARQKLDYEGPLEDLAMAEARRRCIRPGDLKLVLKQTHETIFVREKAAT